mmetsp:Transcript_5459/g.16264  ORF Transcript_5459/g.16264 Transcript_5459/m.16264 type:complete len:145 (+) Transcript_5459:603-1037(+)
MVEHRALRVDVRVVQHLPEHVHVAALVQLAIRGAQYGGVEWKRRRSVEICTSLGVRMIRFFGRYDSPSASGRMPFTPRNALNTLKEATVQCGTKMAFVSPMPLCSCACRSSNARMLAKNSTCTAASSAQSNLNERESFDGGSAL